MTDLEQFIKECEALGKRSDNKRGKDKKPRVNSVERKTPKSTDVVVPVDMTKEEIEAINAGIIASTLGPDSLCWKCLNAHDNIRHSCEKFKTGRPVEGSTYKQEEGPLGTEYNIRTCPCFKFEYDRPQPFRDIVKIIAHWCGVATATVWRNRERFWRSTTSSARRAPSQSWTKLTKTRMTTMMMTLLSEMGNMTELYRTDLICGVGVCMAAVVIIIVAYFAIIRHVESKAVQEALMIISVLAVLLTMSALTCKIVILGKLDHALKGSAAAVIENAGELLRN